MTDPITLTAGDLSATIDPGLGGRVTAFRKGGVDLFTPVDPADTDPGRPISGGCYPLIPWSNRIRDGHFSFDGQEIRLTATEDGTANAIHGHGNRRAWSVVAEGEGALALAYEVPAGEEGWPFPYRAEQSFTLNETGLTITLGCQNTGDGRMPVGLGLHPYFPKRGDLGLWFNVQNAWPPVDGKFPTGATGLPAALDFSEPKPVVTGLDQGFGGWDGTAHLIWPEEGLAVVIEGGATLDHLVLYTPADRDYMCLEPVSHCIDAANLHMRDVEGTGFRTILPGHRLSMTALFKIEVF